MLSANASTAKGYHKFANKLLACAICIEGNYNYYPRDIHARRIHSARNGNRKKCQSIGDLLVCDATHTHTHRHICTYRSRTGKAPATLRRSRSVSSTQKRARYEYMYTQARADVRTHHTGQTNPPRAIRNANIMPAVWPAVIAWSFNSQRQRQDDDNDGDHEDDFAALEPTSLLMTTTTTKTTTTTTTTRTTATHRLTE